MSTAVLMACMLTFISDIFGLGSLHGCCVTVNMQFRTQFIQNAHTVLVYVWLICCKHCHNVATSLLIMATSDLWSWTLVLLLKSISNGTFSDPCSISSASLSMLLYHYCALNRILPAKAVGQRVTLSGISLCPHLMPSYTCNKLASRPTPDASISRYRGFKLPKMLCIQFLWLAIWLFYTSTGILYSMTIQSLPTSVFLVVHALPAVTNENLLR